MSDQPLPIRRVAPGLELEFDRMVRRGEVLTTDEFLVALDDFWDIAYGAEASQAERQ